MLPQLVQELLATEIQLLVVSTINSVVYSGVPKYIGIVYIKFCVFLTATSLFQVPVCPVTSEDIDANNALFILILNTIFILFRYSIHQNILQYDEGFAWLCLQLHSI